MFSHAASMTPQKLCAQKSQPLKGHAVVPGDKSISHRALMFGALTKGETIINGLLEGEDIFATAAAMKALGAHLHRDGKGIWRVNGIGIGQFSQPSDPLDMGNSGTSTRLLMGLLGTHGIRTQLIGDASLTRRPMGRITKPLSLMGATFETSEGDRLPLTVIGTDNAKGIEYETPVASAQVKSAILLAGLNAKGPTTVIEKTPTRDHTENMLRFFGANIASESLADGGCAITVQPNPTLMPGLLQVPRDPSSAAFPVAAAVLCEGSDIMCENINFGPTRNGLYLTLQEMGADITIKNERSEGGERIVDLHVKGTGPLKGIEVPADRVASMIDEFPILSMVAACAQGTTRMTELEELRVKESDRLAVVAEGLEACGVKLEMGEADLTIHGNGVPPKGGALIATHLDHRIAMSFLILSGVTDEPISIDDATPIKTSFPSFIDLMNELGADIQPV